MGSIVTKHRNTRPQPPPSPPSTLRWVLARAHVLQWPSSSLRFRLAQAPPPYVNLWRPNHLVTLFPSPLPHLCMEIGSYDSSPPSPVLTGISSCSPFPPSTDRPTSSSLKFVHVPTHHPDGSPVSSANLLAAISAHPKWQYSDSKNCPNVWHFLIVCDIASHSDQTEPRC